MQDKWWDIAVNPIIGCRHGCPYCWAKKMNNRFKWVKKWEEPEWKEKLWKIRKPSNIWIGNLCDLFGDWIPDWVIECIIANIKLYPQHNFLFLTKQPSRYADFIFPDNCWKGFTDAGQMLYHPNTNLGKNWFVSYEPLFKPVYVLKNIKWIIVGGLTPKPIHKKEWIDKIVKKCKKNKIPLYMKNNAHYPKVIKQFPKELK